MKKLRGIIVCFLVMFLLTGCGSSNVFKSPDKVSLEMVKLLSNGNYKKASELLYLDDKTFIDEKSFEQYLNDNQLNIKDNKKIELVEDDSKDEKDITSKIVKVKIDNNKIFELDTKLKDGKWYVDIGDSYYDSNLTIQVPKGAVVKLNGTTLDKSKLASEEEVSDRASYSYNYSYKYKVDSYKIEKILRGTYDLNVSGDMISESNVKINSNRNRYSESGENSSFSTYDTSVYRLLPKVNDNEAKNIDKYIKEFYGALFNEINKDSDNSLDNLKKYLDDTSIIKERFDRLVKFKDQSNNYSIKTYKNLKLKDIEYYQGNKGYYYSDDTIIVVAIVKISYHYNFDYIGMMASQSARYKEDKDVDKDDKIIIHLKKDKDGYKVVGGSSSIVPYVF